MRLDLIVLLFLLAYAISIVLRMFVPRLPAQSSSEDERARHLQLAADLNVKVSNLKSIAIMAPYLGLAGTCLGIMDAFGGIAMERGTASALI